MTEDYMQIVEGKTKRLEPLSDQPGYGRVHSKDDLTAFNGEMHDIMEGKARLANATNCNVCDFLKALGIPLAYEHQDGDTFITRLVNMIKVEVVVRNEAAGSVCQRHPEIAPGTVFPEPRLEFSYKTSDRKFLGRPIGCDDPILVISEDGAEMFLYHLYEELIPDSPMLVVDDSIMSRPTRMKLAKQLKVCGELALLVNRHLKAAWADQGGRLVDFKIECGETEDGQILVADVIDCDSWRVIYQGQQLSKQKYRDGDDLEEVLRVYQLAEQITDEFCT